MANRAGTKVDRSTYSGTRYNNKDGQDFDLGFSTGTRYNNKDGKSFYLSDPVGATRYNNKPGYVSSETYTSQYSKDREANYEALGGGRTIYYQKRAIDLGTLSEIVWITTDRNSDPPVPPTVGPWGKIVVFARWIEYDGTREL